MVKAKDSTYEESAETPDVSASNIWHGFTQDTTFHGVRFVTMHQAGLFRRLAWAVVILVASVYLVYQIQERVRFYSKEPILVSVDIVFNDTLKFPVIAICNQNQFKFSAAVKDKSNSYLEQFFNKELTPHVSVQKSDPNATTPITPKPPVGLCTKSKANYEAFLNKTWEYLLSHLGHLPQDMIARCRFGNENCSWENFDPIMTDHGLCYKFKGLKSPTTGVYKLPDTKTAGSKAGLNLLLNTESYEYSPGPHASAGFKVVVYEPGDLPVFGSQGEGIAPGTYTFVGLSYDETLRINSKTTNCTHGTKLKYFDSYSQLACLEDCEARKFVERCGCRKSSRWKDDGTPLCTVADSLSCNGIESTTTNITNTGCVVCDAPCESGNFPTSFSFLKTSKNDITKLDGNFLEKMMKANQEARDLRSNTDTNLYQKYLGPMKTFKETAVNARKVYGEIFSADVNKHRENFTKMADRCKHSLNKTARYFGVMGQIYDEFFYSPASLRFPDVTLGAKTLAMNVEEALKIITSQKRSPTTDEGDFVRMVKFELKNMNSTLRDSVSTLKDIQERYTSASPVMPYLTPADIVADLPTYDGFFFKKPIVDSAENVLNKGRCNEYYNLAEANQAHVKTLLDTLNSHDSTKPVDWATFTAKRDSFITDTLKLANKRVEVMKKFLQGAMEYVDWKNQTMLQHEAASKAMTDGMINDLDFRFSDFKINAKYEAWVDNLKDKGLLDMSKIAKDGKAADQGIRSERFQYTIYKLREYLTEANARFARLKEIFDVWENYVYLASHLANNEITWVPGAVPNTRRKNGEKMTEVALDINACWYMISTKVQKVYWRQYFDQVKGDLERVVEVIAPEFEDLKASLDEYSGELEPTGTFYKNNFAEVDMYFQEMSYRKVEQQLAYDIVALLSDIGGSMGLLVGGSCLTVIELIDTVVIVCQLCLTKAKRIGTKGQTKNIQ
ncbi:uncharacterized protein LOC135488615 [Lineus longissimus]|uniref:uncharacterized protein LOC135488615 n=1 Tax=Lineus longissimus TaxID=88925 RepID=UPI00315CCE67